MKTFIEKYEEVHGKYPGHDGEFGFIVTHRIMDFIPIYIDYAINEKMGKQGVLKLIQAIMTDVIEEREKQKK